MDRIEVVRKMIIDVFFRFESKQTTKRVVVEVLAFASENKV